MPHTNKNKYIKFIIYISVAFWAILPLLGAIVIVSFNFEELTHGIVSLLFVFLMLILLIFYLKKGVPYLEKKVEEKFNGKKKK